MNSNNVNKIGKNLNSGMVTRVPDGDGLYVMPQNGIEEIELRLIGIDAPEKSVCKKLLQDEREAHMPGQLLVELGRQSHLFLRSLVPIGTIISYYSDQKNSHDLYNRLLVFAYLPNGACINELLLKKGYAKVLDKYQCDELAHYRTLNFDARRNKKGLYHQVENF